MAVSLPRENTGEGESTILMVSRYLHDGPLLTSHQYSPELVMLIDCVVPPVLHKYLLAVMLAVKVYGLVEQMVLSAPSEKTGEAEEVIKMLSLDEQPLTAASSQYVPGPVTE